MEGKTAHLLKKEYHSSPGNHTNHCFHLFFSILPPLSSLHHIVQHHLQPVTNFLKPLIPFTEKIRIHRKGYHFLLLLVLQHSDSLPGQQKTVFT